MTCKRGLKLFLELSLGTVTPARFDLATSDSKVFEDYDKCGCSEMGGHADKGISIS